MGDEVQLKTCLIVHCLLSGEMSDNVARSERRSGRD